MPDKHNQPTPPTREIGRTAFRLVDNTWWVAYYGLPGTLDADMEANGVEVARIRASLVNNHPQRRDLFVKLVQSGVVYLLSQLQPGARTDARPALILPNTEGL